MPDEQLESTSAEKPFVIELEQRDPTPGGNFTPAASLKVTPALRTSGLLRDLPPDDVAWLVFLLTFVSPNGNCRASLEELCAAMHVSNDKARRRMSRLCSVHWDGWPLVIETPHESGLTTYGLSDKAILYEQKESLAPPEPTYTGGFRDEIIAHSRATYARPRAEVERMVEEQMGYVHPQIEEDESVVELRRQLESAGVNRDQTYYLLGAYDRERIERQLVWLPYRNAKNPAGLLIAAIEGDYDEPMPHRFQATIDAANEATVNEVPNE